MKTNGAKSAAPDKAREAMARALVRFEHVVHNMLQSREALLRKSMDPRRSIEDECGHPKGPLTIEEYQELYDYNGVATRVVEVFPHECWKINPEVYEDEDPDVLTPFEEAFNSLGSQLRGNSWFNEEGNSPLWEYCKRLDVLCGIGRYGVLLIGTDDGADLSTPLPMRSTSEDTSISPRKLTYLRCFPEMLAQITQIESDKTNPRYGQPVRYNLTVNDPRVGGPSGGVIGYNTSTLDVHWTRVLHLADNLGSSEVFGVPRMQPVQNRLLDLNKLYGGSAEMYYKGAFPGLSFETHPELGGEVEMDDDEIKDMAEAYFNGLQRYLITWGFSARSLSPQVVDPSPQIRVQIEGICIRLGIPRRIFMGSERGELASVQDDDNWSERLRLRQNNHLTHREIVPLTDRLISIGVLPVPNYRRKRSGYRVCWPPMDSQTANEKAANAAKLAQALMQYVTGGVKGMMTPLDFFVYVFGLSAEEAKGIAERAKELAKLEPPPPVADGNTQRDRFNPSAGQQSREAGTNLSGQTNAG